MQKNAVTATVATLIMGIFGAFLRWLQNRNLYEEDTGLPAPHAAISIAFVLFSALMIVLMAGMILIWLRRWERPQDAEILFRVTGPAPAALAWLLCVVTVLCGIVLMFTAGTSEFPMLRRMLGAASIVAGAAFPFLPGRVLGGASPLSKPAATYLPLFYCFWMIFAYRSNAENPILWSYAPEILALVATTIAFYCVAGVFYRRRTCAAALIFCQIAAYLDISILSDGRARVFQAMFAVSAILLLLMEYLMVSNLKAPPSDESKASPERRGVSWSPHGNGRAP